MSKDKKENFKMEISLNKKAWFSQGYYMNTLLVEPTSVLCSVNSETVCGQ